MKRYSLTINNRIIGVNSAVQNLRGVKDQNKTKENETVLINNFC